MAITSITRADGSIFTLGTAGNDTIVLTTANDVVDAGAGNDLIIANDGADTVVGGAGNDTVYLGRGNDLFAGGEGTDTAIMSGAKADYTLSSSFSTGVITITGKAGTNGAVDGTDLLTSVEKLRFSDGLFLAIPGTSTQGAVALQLALSGVNPGQTGVNQLAANVYSAGGLSQFVNNQMASFATVDAGTLATNVLANLGISNTTLGGTAPASSFTVLKDALQTFLAVFPQARGQVLINLVTSLATLSNNDVFGTAAKGLNAKLDASLGADFTSNQVTLVGIAPGPDDINLTGVVLN